VSSPGRQRNPPDPGPEDAFTTVRLTTREDLAFGSLLEPAEAATRQSGGRAGEAASSTGEGRLRPARPTPRKDARPDLLQPADRRPSTRFSLVGLERRVRQIGVSPTQIPLEQLAARVPRQAVDHHDVSRLVNCASPRQWAMTTSGVAEADGFRTTAATTPRPNADRQRRTQPPPRPRARGRSSLQPRYSRLPHRGARRGAGGEATRGLECRGSGPAPRHLAGAAAVVAQRRRSRAIASQCGPFLYTPLLAS